MENWGIFVCSESFLGLLCEYLAVHEPGQGAEADVVAVEVHDERGQRQPVEFLNQVWVYAEARKGTYFTQ